MNPSRAGGIGGHRICGIEDEIQEHLLELHAISRHQRELPGKGARDRHPPADQVGVGEVQHFGGDLVEGNRQHLRLAAFQERSQTLYHLAGPPVLVNDVGEDVLHLGQVRRHLGQQALRRLGIGENDGERLIQLVGERAGEFAQGCDPGDVGAPGRVSPRARASPPYTARPTPA